MKRKHALIMVLATVILAAVAFHSSTRKVPDKGIGGTSTGETSTSVVRQMAIASATSLAISQDEIGRKDARRQLDLALAAVKGIATASEARQVLLELRAYLASLPPELASAVIADFLSDPSRDAPTRIEFSIGKTGFLDGHPTLRVALLDWLGQIHPAQAGVVAEKILATPTHADEWAVSLRNYARASSDSESREFLQAKTEELIRNQVWRENPSVGFLEAFDILVHAHATESSALLGELVADQTPEGKAIAHAAYLTLDRLTICEPVAMMKQLAGQPNLTKVRGPMVANMFARAANNLEFAEKDSRSNESSSGITCSTRPAGPANLTPSLEFIQTPASPSRRTCSPRHGRRRAKSSRPTTRPSSRSSRHGSKTPPWRG